VKKILGLAIAIVLIIGAVAGATWAYFSDTEDTSDNVFTAGTLQLKLSDNDETDQDGVTASWYNTNMAPGDSCSGWVKLKNSGTLAADHVEISFANTVNDVVYPNPSENDDDISDSLIVTGMTYGTTNFLEQTTPGTFDNTYIEAADSNNDDIITLYELNGVTIDDLTEVPSANGTDFVEFDMTVQLDPATGDGNQGDSVTTVITFTLNQDVSQ
jgi:predicted ribosomally synthesized peptide with SipW-like signal peptide